MSKNSASIGVKKTLLNTPSPELPTDVIGLIVKKVKDLKQLAQMKPVSTDLSKIVSEQEDEILKQFEKNLNLEGYRSFSYIRTTNPLKEKQNSKTEVVVTQIARSFLTLKSQYPHMFSFLYTIINDIYNNTIFNKDAKEKNNIYQAGGYIFTFYETTPYLPGSITITFKLTSQLLEFVISDMRYKKYIINHQFQILHPLPPIKNDYQRGLFVKIYPNWQNILFSGIIALFTFMMETIISEYKKNNFGTQTINTSLTNIQDNNFKNYIISREIGLSVEFPNRAFDENGRLNQAFNDSIPEQELPKKGEASLLAALAPKVGGHKQKQLARSKENITYQKKLYTIYLGTRGGKYIKLKGNFVLLSQLQLR